MMNQETFKATYKKLKEMRLSGMAEELRNYHENPNADLKPTPEILEDLVNAEWALRRGKKIAKMLKKSNLKYPEACFNEAVWEGGQGICKSECESLLKFEWIDQDVRNILITGKTGSGKTWLACALGVSAIQNGKTVCYRGCSRLLEELAIAEISNSLGSKLDEYQKYDLIILDEFGNMSLNTNRCRNLLDLLNEREGKKPIMVISQYPITEWYDMFEHSGTAEGILDRLLGNAYRFDLQGESKRRR